MPAKAGTQNNGLGLDSRRGEVKNITRWSLEHTEHVPTDAASIQMVILDPDRHAPLSSWPAGCLKLASLSVGEAEDSRPYWAKISSAPYLIEQDRDQEGAVRVDFRDPRWQRLLSEEEVPRALRQGYQGLLLDHLDSPPYLEQKDPGRFTGNRAALANWLARLREAYPSLVLLAKGADALVTAAPYVDGYVVEGIFTIWDPAAAQARRSTREERDQALDQIGNALALASRPVFTIDPVGSGDHPLAAWAIKESKKHGFRPPIQVRQGSVE